jgi:DNA-binding NarL/FixJ family response regulator
MGEALAVIERLRPDLVIVDISLKGADGLELIKQAAGRWPELAILVLSMHNEQLYAERALRAGARGYIMKDEATGNVLAAVREVLNGSVYLSAAMRARLLQRLVSAEPQRSVRELESLTDRELGILRLIGKGCTTREIADQLGLSVRTVGSHRARIKRKLKVTSTAQLIQYALQWEQSDQQAGATIERAHRDFSGAA